MSTTTCIIMMAVCLALSAYFSATETAFSSANTTRLRAMAEKGSRNAALACRLLEKYDRLLSTILIGWVIGPKWVIDEVEKNGEHFGRAKLYSVMMRYVVPVVMLILFLTSTGFWNLLFRH